MYFDQEKTQVPQEPQDPRERLRKEVQDYKPALECDRREVGNPMMSQKMLLEELFRYHAPTPEQLPKYAAINQAAKNFAEIILQNCPHSQDRSRAFELLQDARMVANRAIALNGLHL